MSSSLTRGRWGVVVGKVQFQHFESHQESVYYTSRTCVILYYDFTWWGVLFFGALGAASRFSFQ